MIPRYEKKEISKIWTDENKFKTYLKVELAILQALEENQQIPKGTTDIISGSARINSKRIEEIEQETRHDIIAFCTSITENLPPEHGKYFHFGVTSSDIIDSALTLQIKESLDVIIPAFNNLLKTIFRKADETKNLVCIGRSHGMYAEPMSFGIKWLGFYAEMSRRLADLQEFISNDLTVQFSGAVGNYTILSPQLENRAAQILGLKVETLSTQVVPRDRIAKLVSINALIAAAIERTCVEIRHLHHSDVNELYEGFSRGQKGSSTMPHKKNPISTENLTGIARTLRSHTTISQDNVVLWHERDISHSSAERMYLPDNLGLLLYAIIRLNNTLENIQFNKEKIQEKVKNNFSYLSSYYLHQLILETDLPRDTLYQLVQQAAFKGQEEKSMIVFHNSLQNSLRNINISVNLIKPNFDEIKKIYLKHTDDIFKRVLDKHPLPL